MMTLLFSILGILITIFFVIGTHEAAHFMAARLLSVKVLTFSIGFGKTLFRWQDKHGTEYLLGLIPLGGYVRMLDEQEGDVPDAERHLAYNSQPYYKKFLIVAAGPAMNIFCAFLLYWIIFTVGFNTLKPIIGAVTPHSIAADAGLKPNDEIVELDKRTVNSWMSVIFRMLIHLGNQETLQIVTRSAQSDKLVTHTLNMSQWQVDKLKPDPLASLGIKPFEPVIPLVIGVIEENSTATRAGLQIGDEIIALNHEKIANWDQLTHLIKMNRGKASTITINRHGKLLVIPFTLGNEILGIGPNYVIPKNLLRHIQYTPLAALPHAWQEISDFTYFNVLLFSKLCTGKLSIQSLGGPITIFESAGDALNSGWLAFLGFLAFLSISIGVINIFPIPGLDGGHLLLQTIEAIFQRSIPERYLALLFRLGFLFLAFILFQSIINDVLRVYN